MLESSAHNQSVLEKSNQLLGSPLQPDQSLCLLCHDEPNFCQTDMTWGQQEAPIERCNVCHNQELPVNTRYYYWHVNARSRPARSNQEMIRLCAVCHSNEKIRQEFELPDSTASYLASFHGKAALLGTQETATCLDCHVNQLQNVHLMQSNKSADSATHPNRLADTCRSTDCHPTAGRQVSSAAVHLNLATSRGIEYFIAAIFVLLIIFTFGPSAMLMMLNMFQVIIGRSDPADRENHLLAKKLMANPQARRLLKRFTPFQRVQHWALVITFAILVATGYPMKFADHSWAAWFIAQIGGLSVARIIHRLAGAAMLIGFAYHLLIYVGAYVLKESRRTRKGLILTVLNLPMCMNLDDFKKMGQWLLYLLFLRKTRPKWGRFSLEEKFEYFGVLWGTVLLGVTGILMWDDSLTTRFLPGRALTIANVIHSFESYLALLHVGVVHLAGVIISPHAFPCSPAMFTGNTPVEELAEIHPALLEEVENQLTNSKPHNTQEADDA